MEIKIAPLPEGQRLFAQRQSTQIEASSGLIGQMHGDFGKTDEMFSAGWVPFDKSRVTQQFNDELADVISELRQRNILAGCTEENGYSELHSDAAVRGSEPVEYAFRAETKDHAYLLKVTPNGVNSHFTCYCYKKIWLDRFLQNARSGIRFIYPDYKLRFYLPDGDAVRIVRASGEAQDYTARYIDDYHLELNSGRGGNIYHICELAEMLARNGTMDVIPLRSSLPEQCYSSLAETGEIILLKKGESGYYKTGIAFSDREEARQIINEYNSKLGVSRAQEEAMKAGSMFSWAAPAANPASYDTEGKLNLRASRQGWDR